MQWVRGIASRTHDAGALAVPTTFSMTLVQLVYNYLLSGAALIALPALWCRERRDPQRRAALSQRLGHVPPPPAVRSSGRPKVWIHAVSVGEVKAAATIIDALDRSHPGIDLVLTTTTTTGQGHAQRLLGDRLTVAYAPLDLWPCTTRFLVAHRPDMLVCMETEIWPNWIAKAHAAGIRTAFLNGRLSQRSIRAYRRIRFLIRPVLQKVDAFSMISEGDAQRIVALGAPDHRVIVNGNVKMDAGVRDGDMGAAHALMHRYALAERPPVFVAGSIRGAELPILMDVYTHLAALVPNLVFIAAPRHIENASRLARLADERRIGWQFRTDLDKSGGIRRAPMVILNTIGELRSVYAIASVVFCGGSLVPLGGQNVLEAAAWAKPVLFGPSMEDFEDARQLLEKSGGGICVRNGSELVAVAHRLLTHPEEARRRGSRARGVVRANQGAADRHARLIADLLRIV